MIKIVPSNFVPEHIQIYFDITEIFSGVAKRQPLKIFLFLIPDSISLHTVQMVGM